MIGRVLTFIPMLFLFAGLSATAASAEELYYSMRCVVIDADTSRPVSDARVHLTSPYVKLSGVSDLDGEYAFEHVPPGVYRVDVNAAGYQPVVDSFTAKGNSAQLELRIVLVRNLVTIGSVQSRSRVEVRQVSRDAIFSPLFPDFAEMLNQLGGASITTDSFGQIGAVAFAGKDASLSHVAFDGVDLSDSVARHALDPDLIHSAQLDEAQNQAAFFSINPSPWTQYSLDGMESGYGGSRAQGSMQTTVGRVGVAGIAVERAQQSALYGARYVDSSGIDYVHNGGLQHRAGLVKLAIPLSDTFTASLSSIATAGRVIPTSAYFSGAVPNGDGPGNAQYSHASIERFAIQGAPGHFLTMVAASTVQTGQFSDQSNRYVAGIPAPYRSEIAGRQHEFDFSVVDLIAGTRTLNLSVMLRTNENRFTMLDERYASSSLMALQSSRLFTATVSQTAEHTRSLRSLLEAALQRRDGASAANVTAALDFGHAPNSYRASWSAGTTLPQVATPAAFGDPASAVYDCQGTITVTGPNDRPATPTTHDVRVSYTHASSRATVSANVYTTSIVNGTLSAAYVPLASAGALPPGYLAGLMDGFLTVGRCGTVAAPPVGIFVSEDVAGISVRNRGLDIVTAQRVSKAVSAQLTVRLLSSVFTATSPKLNGVGSPYISGRQVPWQPPVTANAAVAWTWGDGRSQILLSEDYVSRNNARHLPPYLLSTVGFARRLSPSFDVVVVAANAVDQYPGDFTSGRYAVPVPTVGGGLMPIFAAPLPHQRLFLTLRAKVDHRGSF